jgi:Uma2 family endonuclease
MLGLGKEADPASAHARFPRMTADEFIPWAMAQPEGRRYELVAGEIIAVAPERAGHNEGKGNAYLSLRETIRGANLPCRVYMDGMAVRVDADTVYQPDALVRCGERLGPDVVEIADPVIVVEVISPSTHKVDTTQKLADYFRVASVRHYLIVNTSRRAVVHHERGADGGIRTRIATSGALGLDPPGIELAVESLFPDQD